MADPVSICGLESGEPIGNRRGPLKEMVTDGHREEGDVLKSRSLLGSICITRGALAGGG